MKKGFTLIELLVVVLIIGILSAVALPQYTKAVAKSRFSEAMTNLRSLSEAVKVCEMSNGRIDRSANETCLDYDNLMVNFGEKEDGNEARVETKNFLYQIDRGYLNGIDTMAVAYYRREDVCICIHEDNTFAAASGSSCGNPDPPYDVTKLLNLTDSNCICC